MSEITISDPAQWRAGDYFKGAYEGHPFEGEVWGETGGALYAGATCILFHPGNLPTVATGSVTRTVPDIEEPTSLGAVATFADGAVAVRADAASDSYDRIVWREVAASEWRSWLRMTERHGPAVSVQVHAEQVQR